MATATVLVRPVTTHAGHTDRTTRATHQIWVRAMSKRDKETGETGERRATRACLISSNSFIHPIRFPICFDHIVMLSSVWRLSLCVILSWLWCAGRSWSHATPIPGTGCARPRLLSMGVGKPMLMRYCTVYILV
jgi:hypothetical protein